eukprot:8949953-Pyramimonas_sp.AAC.1
MVQAVRSCPPGRARRRTTGRVQLVRKPSDSRATIGTYLRVSRIYLEVVMSVLRSRRAPLSAPHSQ